MECSKSRIVMIFKLMFFKISWSDFDEDLSKIIKEHTHWIKTMMFLYERIKKPELKKELHHVVTWNKIKLKILSNLNGNNIDDFELRISALDVVRFIIYPKKSERFNRFKWIILLVAPIKIKRNAMKRYFSIKMHSR